MKYIILVLLIFSVVIQSCICNKTVQNSKDNSLSDEEKLNGWELLFDGNSLGSWHTYGLKTIGSAWKIDDNSIRLDANNKKDWQSENGGDIVSANEYDNFHLKLDWKVEKEGNSGIIFYVHEDPAKYKYAWMTGPEMQVLDNAGHPDAKIIKHRAGDLYDLITAKETVKPAEQWNHAEIISNKGNLKFFLNGEKVMETMMWDDKWRTMIKNSKFHEFPSFGTYKKGKIMLQDHGNNVWFKNIKIKRL